MVEEKPIPREELRYPNEPMMRPEPEMRGGPDFNRGFESIKEMDMMRPRPFPFPMNPSNFPPNNLGPGPFMPQNPIMGPVRGFNEGFPPNDRMNMPNPGPSGPGFAPMKNDFQPAARRKDDSPKRKAISPKQRSPSPGSPEDFTNMRPREIAIFLQKKREAKMGASGGGVGGADRSDNRWGDKSDDRNNRDKEDGFGRGRGYGGPQEQERFGGKPQQFGSMDDYFNNDFGRGDNQGRRMPMNQGPNPGMRNPDMRQPMNQGPYQMHPKEDMMRGEYGNQGMPGPNNTGNSNQMGNSGYHGGPSNMPYNQGPGTGSSNMGPGSFRFQPSSGRPEPPIELAMRKMGPDQNPPWGYGGNSDQNRGGGVWSGNRGPNEGGENFGRDDRQRGPGNSFSMRKDGPTSNSSGRGAEGYQQNKMQVEYGNQKKTDMQIEPKKDSDDDRNDNLEEGEMADNPLLKHKEGQKLMEVFLKNPDDKRIQKLLERAKFE